MDFFYSRRLTDRIMAAFRTACEEDDLETAARLLVILELAIMKSKIDGALNRRKGLQALTDAHEHLWHLRRQADLPEEPEQVVPPSGSPSHGGQASGPSAHLPL
jgi:hypothetical protein